ncbi:MAG TPA: heavy metal sensor histidine kinase [Syntrophorhabdaceae bacterium]|jgi:two-component system heavy metal sensor histidine kinase CusS
MSLKNVLKKLTSKASLSSLKTLSITRRLTILYAVATLSLLATSAIFLDRILITDMASEDNRFLAAEVHNLRMLMAKHPHNINIWKEEVERGAQASALTYIRHYARIIDTDNTVAVEAPGMSRVVMCSSFPPPSASDVPPEEGVRVVGLDKSPLLLVAARVDLNTPVGGQKIIQIALDVSHEDAIIADYREKVAIVLFAGMILSTLIGFSIAHEGLRPLKAMRKAFKSIGPGRLHHRMGSREWPDEIAVLADAFDGMLERLENSFTALSRFSADLAHELRTPINNLRGEAEVTLFKARTTDEYRQVLESSLEEYGRLSRMIENLLFLAHAESPDTMLRQTRIHVGEVIEALLEFFDPIAEEKGIEVTASGDAEMEVDPTLFRHALSNILSNAFQYTPSGGKITVTVQTGDDGAIQVDIVDTGMGIEAEHLAQVFNRFFRTGRARAQHPQGTGLGFSIVKSIMDLHGGAVIVQSEPGMGTTVTLRFPQP